MRTILHARRHAQLPLDLSIPLHTVSSEQGSGLDSASNDAWSVVNFDDLGLDEESE